MKAAKLQRVNSLLRFLVSRDFDGAHIDFKMAASMRVCSNDRGFSKLKYLFHRLRGF